MTKPKITPMTSMVNRNHCNSSAHAAPPGEYHVIYAAATSKASPGPMVANHRNSTIDLKNPRYELLGSNRSLLRNASQAMTSDRSSAFPPGFLAMQRTLGAPGAGGALRP